MALQLPCEKTLTRTGYAQGSVTHRIPTGRLQVPVQGVPRTGMIQGFHRYQSAHLCGDREIFIFPVQLTTSRIGNLTRLIHTLLYVMTIHTYIHMIFFCGTVHLLMTTTKLRRDTFVQATGDFDGNLCISLYYCRGSCCGSGWCTKA